MSRLKPARDRRRPRIEKAEEEDGEGEAKQLIVVNRFRTRFVDSHAAPRPFRKDAPATLETFDGVADIPALCELLIRPTAVQPIRGEPGLVPFWLFFVPGVRIPRLFLRLLACLVRSVLQ